MPQYLAPGVYIDEVQTGPPPIAGVGTSTAGFVGVTRRGPTSGLPTLITSYADFVRAFGGAFDFGPSFTVNGVSYQDLPEAVHGFFDNGGQTAYVMRVADSSNTTASGTLTGGITTVLNATALTGSDTVVLRDLRGVSAKTASTNGTQLQLQMVYQGITTTSAVFHVIQIDRSTGTVTLDGTLTSDFVAAYTTVFTDLADPALASNGAPTALGTPTDAKPPTFELSASSTGSWGTSLQIVPSIQSAAQAGGPQIVSGTTDQVQLNTGANFYANAWVEFDTGANKYYHQVISVSGPVLTLADTITTNEVTSDSGYSSVVVSSCEFGLTISYTDPVEGVTVQETYNGLTLANVPGRYYEQQLSVSGLVEVTGAGPSATHPFLFPSAPNGQTIGLTGGNETTPPSDNEVIGQQIGPNQDTGLYSLADVDEISIIAAPGITTQTVQQAMIDQCELLMYRFAVLDPAPGASNAYPALPADIQTQRNLYDSEYAALYYPRVTITNPISSTPATRTVAPSGHVMGVYARVDQTRGVYKAPANELIQGILSLETVVTQGVQEILNPLNINVLRDFTSMQRGLRVYGARCITSDTDWMYVNVRRLFIFIEQSLDIGTQWAVFEPNDQKLWAQLKDSVTLFLTSVWQDGALMGTTAAQAFYVTIDETTMSPDDILNGRLIMRIGIAPVRPAEFVIIQIGQWLGGSSVQET
jgi:uncharacterized protein